MEIKLLLGSINSQWIITIMYQSIPSLIIPSGNFLKGRIPTPQTQRKCETPTSEAEKVMLKSDMKKHKNTNREVPAFFCIFLIRNPNQAKKVGRKPDPPGNGNIRILWWLLGGGQDWNWLIHNQNILKILTKRNNSPLRWVHELFHYFQQLKIWFSFFTSCIWVWAKC